MPRLQSFAPLLRPLAGPRAVASRPYLRFSTASKWQVERQFYAFLAQDIWGLTVNRASSKRQASCPTFTSAKRLVPTPIVTPRSPARRRPRSSRIPNRRRQRAASRPQASSPLQASTRRQQASKALQDRQCRTHIQRCPGKHSQHHIST